MAAAKPGRPKTASAAKLNMALSILEDIIDAMRLPVHESDRLKSRIARLRND